VSARGLTSTYIGGHIVLQTEIAALRWPFWRQEGDVPAHPSRLPLKVLEIVVSSGSEHLTTLHQVGVLHDAYPASVYSLLRS
jgi:hypothetical protein